jgi:hypothetical protein
MEVPVPSSRRSSALLITTGALGVAATTALEVVTAPYSPAVSAYPLNGAVHAGKVVAAIVLAAGLVGLVGFLADLGARVGALAAGGIAVGAVVGAVPYSVVEATLDPSLAPAAAEVRLEQIHATQAWIGAAASVAFPLSVLAVVVLAVVVLRRRTLPAWAPIASIAAIPVAVVAGLLGDAGWVLPHPPAWMFLGLAAYGPALARAGTERAVVLTASQRS